ncbi:MAG TPA: PilZ domain-containing protein [Vicinamibacterales bacterium]|nr:PilZ domain-containing protein [Vicinamibacterales bacterium]
MSAEALVIAAENLMPALRERVKVEGEIITYPDTEPIQALQTIMEQRPSLVVLERLFAATPRGAALINRIKSDPQLAHAEVRVMSHTGDYTRQVVKPTATKTPAPGTTDGTATAPQASPSSVATEEAPKALDWHGTRRAPRFRVRTGVELQLDGNPAVVIDLSTVGAQVISPTVLRPNQKVRIALPNDDFLLRFRGAVAWAKFELPKKPVTTPQYRAGVEFTDGDAAAIESVINRNRS